MNKRQVIQDVIYEVRGERVMLDFDLAKLYDVETRVFNQAVKRNIESFPKDFMFRLTAKNGKKSPLLKLSNENEKNSSQIVMSSIKHRSVKYLPYAFTELVLQCLQVFLKVLRQEK